MDFRNENLEKPSIEIQSSGNEVKESAESDFGEYVEFLKIENPAQLSSSVGSYGNVSSEFVLADFSVSEIDETDSKECKNTKEVHFDLESCETITQIGTKAAEVFMNGHSSTPTTIFLKGSSIFKQFDPLRPFVLQKSPGYSSERGSLLMRSIDFLSINSSDISNPSGDSLTHMKSTKPLTPRVLFPQCTESPKQYTEDDLRTALKDQEVRLTAKYMKSCIENEFKFIDQISERELELLNKVEISKCYSAIVSEMLNISGNLKKNCKELEDKLKFVKKECASLVSDKNKALRDISEYKNARFEISKRYEQIKSMLETCKKNESTLTKNIANVQTSLCQQNNIDCILNSRMVEIEAKRNEEIELAKKSVQHQTAILNAQVRKAQLKIDSLESTLEQARLENKELVIIYDELLSTLKA